MVDTVHISQERYNILEKEFNALIKSADRTTYNAATQTYYHVTKIGNLSLFINDRGLSVKGSLSGFYHGNNLTALNRQTLPLAIDLLEDSLNIPLRSAKIRRLDMAHNIILDHHPSMYYQYLGSSNFQQRLEHENGLEQRNGERKNLLYDKVAEARKKKIPIPAELADLNIGRFETSFQGKASVNRHMGTEELTLGELCNTATYNQMYQVWGKEFDAIEKINNGTDFRPEVFREPKTLCNQLIYDGIKSHGGPIALRSMVKSAHMAGIFETPRQYAATRRKMRQLNSLPDLSEPSYLIAELEEKVRDIVLISA